VLGKPLRELRPSGMEIDRRRVLEPPNLLLNALDNLGMAVSDRNCHDPRKRVEILPTALVPDVLHVPFNDHQRITIIRDQTRREILAPEREDFVATRAFVGGWDVC
jgi:hypothetical protein